MHRILAEDGVDLVQMPSDAAAVARLPAGALVVVVERVLRFDVWWLHLAGNCGWVREVTKGGTLAATRCEASMEDAQRWLHRAKQERRRERGGALLLQIARVAATQVERLVSHSVRH